MGVCSELAAEAVDVAAWDARMAQLALGHGLLRLRIGEVAEALVGGGKHHELGFANQHAYAYERVSKSGAWLGESRRVAKRLVALPEVRWALTSGAISWKMAELLARHATADDEALIVAAARRSTVREMAEVLAESAESKDVQTDEDGERYCTVVRRVGIDTLWDCAVTSQLVDHLDGQAQGDGWLAAVLAEATSTLHNTGVDPLIESVGDECTRWSERRRAAEALRVREEVASEQAAEARGRAPWARDDLERAAWDERADDEPLPDAPVALDAMLRRLVRELDRMDLALGAQLDLFRQMRGFSALGYASLSQYARERLGLGRSAMWQKIRLSRGATRLPALGDAVARGMMGQEAAALVARVADAESVGPWLERAGRRTYDHIRQEVEVAERRAAERGLKKAPLPPNDVEMEHFFAEERGVLSGERLRAALEEDAVRMCERPAATGHELRLRVPESVFREFRMMEVAYGRAGMPGEFVSFLCRQLWAVWLPMLGESDKWEHIYARDGYKCACPVCDKRDVTLHHLRYQSHGGGHEPSNVLSICYWHHLEGEHAGRLKVRGPASRPTWELGRRGEPPLMRVVGRELLASA